MERDERTIASETQNTGSNALLTISVIALNLYLFLGAPLLLAMTGGAGAIWILAPAALAAVATPTHWSLLHEAIHGLLFEDRQTNERAGRVVSVLYGAPFQLLRLGHLMHHRFNRSQLNRQDVVAGDGPPGFHERALYYGKLFGGLYFGVVFANLLAILPEPLYRRSVRVGFGAEAEDGRTMWRAAEQQLIAQPGRSRMMTDGAAATALFASAILLYGAWWPAFAAMIYVRALLVSMLDNAYHYANPLDDPAAGWDLKAPRWLQAALLNFNFHAAHHAKPSEPWRRLPAVFAERGGRYGGSLASAVARQLKGPIPERAFTAANDDALVQHMAATDRTPLPLAPFKESQTP